MQQAIPTISTQSDIAKVMQPHSAQNMVSLADNVICQIISLSTHHLLLKRVFIEYFCFGSSIYVIIFISMSEYSSNSRTFLSGGNLLNQMHWKTPFLKILVKMVSHFWYSETKVKVKEKKGLMLG